MAQQPGHAIYPRTFAHSSLRAVASGLSLILFRAGGWGQEAWGPEWPIKAEICGQSHQFHGYHSVVAMAKQVINTIRPHITLHLNGC